MTVSDSTTVLLVGEVKPDDKLIEELEKQDVIVEVAQCAELESLLTLVEPALVVQIGKAGTVATVNLLKKQENTRRIRLVVLAARLELPELRKLDRSVVLSLLATDIAPTVIAARVTMLAKKSQTKSQTPPPVAVKERAPAPSHLLAKKPLSGHAPNKPEGDFLKSGDTLDISVQSPTPSQLVASNALTLNPGAVVPKELTKLAPKKLETKATQEQKEETPRGTHIALADTDTTRGDLIASALRAAGLATRLVPLDPGATHWSLIRDFAPTVLLADDRALRTTGQVWHQLFQADKALKKAKLVTLPFGRIFNDQDGSVNLRTLIPHFPELSKVATKKIIAPSTTLATNEHNAGSVTSSSALQSEIESPCDEAEDESVNDRATLIQPDDFPPPEALRPASIAPPPQGTEEEVELDESLELESIRPQEMGPHAPGITPAPVARTVSPRKTKSTTLAWGAAAAALLLGFGAWYALKAPTNIRVRAASSSITKKSALPLPTSTPETLRAKEDKEEALVNAKLKELEKSAKNSLWTTTAPSPVPSCSSLVPHLKELSKGGLQQATLSWKKARKNLVLGDLDKAHTFMCEAALLHPKSLAIEGLSQLYLMKQDPIQAKEWIVKALSVRPDRSKTKMLSGDVESQLGNIEEARAIWLGTLKVKTTDSKSLALIAAKYVEDARPKLRSGSISGANILYRRAAILHSKNIAALTGLGATCLAAGQTKSAKAWAEKALTFDKGSAGALVVLADIAAQENRVPEAIVLYKKALETAPNNRRSHQQLYKLDEKSR